MNQNMFEPQPIDLIIELERELRCRQRLYPKWIEHKKINEKTAAWRILCLRRTITFLKGKLKHDKAAHISTNSQDFA